MRNMLQIVKRIELYEKDIKAKVEPLNEFI